MELITTAGFAKKIITTIGINAVCSSITTISSASKNIFDIIGGISKTKTPAQADLHDLITRLDMEESIKITESVLKEISRDKITSKTLLLCLDSLSDIIKKIECELHNIDKMMRYNRSLWIFNTFRSYDCSSNMKKLEEHKDILDMRLKRFVDLLNIKGEFKHSDTTDHDKEYITISNNDAADGIIL